MNEAIRMQLSAFVDGELPENEKELLLRRLSQDADLRRQVSEFLVIGRAMRGEVQVEGLEGLRQRVAAAISGEPVELLGGDHDTRDERLIRPLAGFAIAAAVAFVAIFGLQRFAGVEEVEPLQESPTAYTEPGPDDYMRELRRSHSATALELGVNSIKVRWTSLPTSGEMLGEEIVDEPNSEDLNPDGDPPDAASTDDNGTLSEVTPVE